MEYMLYTYGNVIIRSLCEEFLWEILISASPYISQKFRELHVYTCTCTALKTNAMHMHSCKVEFMTFAKVLISEQTQETFH